MKEKTKIREKKVLRICELLIDGNLETLSAKEVMNKIKEKQHRGKDVELVEKESKGWFEENSELGEQRSNS